MLNQCGRVRSFANGHRNGGSWKTSISVPSTFSNRHGTPPNHLSASHTMRNATPRATNDTARRIRGPVATGAKARGLRARETAVIPRSSRRRSPVGHRLVGDVERGVDDLEARRQLVLVDAQWRVRVDRVVGQHRVEAVLAEILADR